jgi:hypothetical protein
MHAFVFSGHVTCIYLFRVSVGVISKLQSRIKVRQYRPNVVCGTDKGAVDKETCSRAIYVPKLWLSLRLLRFVIQPQLHFGKLPTFCPIQVYVPQASHVSIKSNMDILHKPKPKSTQTIRGKENVHHDQPTTTKAQGNLCARHLPTESTVHLRVPAARQPHIVHRYAGLIRPTNATITRSVLGYNVRRSDSMRTKVRFATMAALLQAWAQATHDPRHDAKRNEVEHVSIV